MSNSALIYDAVRTPRSKGKSSGTLHEVKPIDLGAGLLNALRDRNDLDTSYVDDVVLGCVSPVGEQGSDVAKMIVQNAGWDESVAGVQLNRFCASGLEAVNTAAAKVAAGWDQLVVAGGIECMSRVPMGSDGGAMAGDAAFAIDQGFVPQGIGADTIATLDGYTRENVDAYAMESQKRAAKARDAGWFDGSVIPVKDLNGVTILEKDDFIKADTKNAQSFTEIFHLVQPDVFIDNHVSNGADYQYTLTHLFTQHNKLGGELGEYLHTELMPQLEQNLKESDWDITPYVNVFNRPPETGFSQFMDHPRYSTGYTTLWNTLGMMVETHMLKPYKPRVEGTYELMKQMIFISEKDHDKIQKLKTNTAEKLTDLSTYHLNWQIDTTQTTTLQFKGFEVDTLVSEVTGLNRLKYNRDRQFTKDTQYSNYFIPLDTVQVPAAYVIKKGWQKVIDRLMLNQIDFFELEKDTTLFLQSYRIENYNTRRSAYEGHYLHYDTKVSEHDQEIQLSKGDYLIPTNQIGVRYVLETLEPEAPDSFFNWNFFDTILQQKEGFSPYVFEDVAYELLKKEQTLRDSFFLKKQNDEQFSQNWYAQLDWIFKRSPHYEKAHLQYPVYRILKGSEAESILKN